MSDINDTKDTAGMQPDQKAKPALSADEQMIQDGFNALLQDYLNSNHRRKVERITKAFNFANQAHAGVKRRSGEPYIMHPIAVARIVCREMGLGSTSICSALLHDVVEDTEYTVEDIKDMFGEKIAQIVKREANEMFDARVDFEKLDISLLRHFPRASLDLKGLTVVGAGPFEGDTIVAANRISVVVNPMSLFGDDGFEVTKVILAEPALHAHKLADGKVNWDIVKASGEEPAAGEVSSEEGSSSFSLSIRDFRISDATIRYEDDSTGMRFSTAPLSLRLRGDMSADQTDLDQTDLDLRLTAGAAGFGRNSAAERRRGGARRRDRGRPEEQPFYLLPEPSAPQCDRAYARRLGRNEGRCRGYGYYGRMRQGAVQGRAFACPGILYPRFPQPVRLRRTFDGAVGPWRDARGGAPGLRTQD
jgi:hypothetical protein